MSKLYEQIKYPNSLVVSSIVYNYVDNLLQVYFIGGKTAYFDFDKKLKYGIDFITLDFIKEKLEENTSVGSVLNVYVLNKFPSVELDIGLLFGFYLTNINKHKEYCFDDYVSKYVKDSKFREEVNKTENHYNYKEEDNE